MTLSSRTGFYFFATVQNPPGFFQPVGFTLQKYAIISETTLGRDDKTPDNVGIA